MRAEAWAIFFCGFIFITGGFLMVGYVLDQYYPTEYITIIPEAGGAIGSSGTYTLLMGVIGTFAGVIIGYRLAYDLSIRKYLEREFENTKKDILAELMKELEKK